LATGGAGDYTRDYGILYQLAGGVSNATSSTWLRTNWLGVYSGVHVGGLGDQGTGGYYWSSTGNVTSFAYDLNFNASLVYPAHTSSRLDGYAVRCVL
jgi:hypothetical protein